MRYEILGPVRLIGAHQVVPIETAKIQTVLETLLICHDQIVSVDRLVTEIWGEAPPRRATGGIQVYIYHVRKLVSRVSGGRQPVVTKPSGYLLQLGSDELDLVDFQASVDEGKAAYYASDFERAISCFQRALTLCRGSLLDETRAGPLARGFALRVEETRLEVLELTVSASLALRRYQEAVALLSSLVSEHPLHESFYQKLMVALLHSGRRADALKVYQSARHTLMSELGLEPSLPLRELQHRILTADDAR